jgi:hypothetical protein
VWLRDTKNIVLDRPAVEAGLAVLDAGGDFADGVIAYEGTWLGGESRTIFAQLIEQLQHKEFQKYVARYEVYRFTLEQAFFVVRTKTNVLLQRRYSHPIDPATGVRSDQTVILSSLQSASVYPDPLRKVSYIDAETGKRLVFLTNNFSLPASTIAAIYKQRWQVELFFKWIKQHLRIKAFYGTSENAVKTQIWIAVSVYVLVAIVRKRLELEVSFYQILQVLSLTLSERTPILRVLQSIGSQDDLPCFSNQLNLFNL